MDLSLHGLELSCLASAGLASAVFAWGIASAPIRRPRRLGYRGLRRQRVLVDSSFAIVEPLVRWCGARIGGLLPDKTYDWLDRQLVLSGDYLGLTPEEYIAASLLSVVGSALLGLVYVAAHGAPAAALVFVICGSLAMYMQVAREIDRRARDIARGLPYVIDLLALSMSAGLDFPGAIRQVVCRSTNRDDALTEELERILQELALGHTRREALENFADRTGVTSAVEFVAAVVQSEQRGNPLAETLTIQAQVSRQQRSTRAETLAAKKSTQIYIPLGLLMFSVLLLIGGPLVLTMQNVMGVL
jgi:tight adherence protein C